MRKRNDPKAKDIGFQRLQVSVAKEKLPSERSRRVDLDSRHDGRNELEEHDEVEVYPHSIQVILVCLGRSRS